MENIILKTQQRQHYNNLTTIITIGVLLYRYIHLGHTHVITYYFKVQLLYVYTRDQIHSIDI